MKVISNSTNGEHLVAAVMTPQQENFKRIAGSKDGGPNAITYDVPAGTYYVGFFVTNITGPHNWPPGFLVAQTGGVKEYATVTLTEDDSIVLS